MQLPVKKHKPISLVTKMPLKEAGVGPEGVSNTSVASFPQDFLKTHCSVQSYSPVVVTVAHTERDLISSY